MLELFGGVDLSLEGLGFWELFEARGEGGVSDGGVGD